MSIELRAPATGTLIEIYVRESDAVTAGQELFVIESMKMEIPVTSPVAATVQSMPVSEGVTVAEGDVLAVLERTD